MALQFCFKDTGLFIYSIAPTQTTNQRREYDLQVPSAVDHAIHHLEILKDQISTLFSDPLSTLYDHFKGIQTQ